MRLCAAPSYRAQAQEIVVLVGSDESLCRPGDGARQELVVVGSRHPPDSSRGRHERHAPTSRVECGSPRLQAGECSLARLSGPAVPDLGWRPLPQLRGKRGGLPPTDGTSARQPLAASAEVRRDVAQDAREGADSEGRGTGDGDVMLPTLERRQAKMAPGLAVHPVAEVSESSRELVTGDVARKPQAEMTSSRTKWRRMIRGAFSSSKWHRTASRMFACRPGMSSASVKIDSPSARAVKPPSGASSTRKISSDASRVLLLRRLRHKDSARADLAVRRHEVGGLSVDPSGQVVNAVDVAGRASVLPEVLHGCVDGTASLGNLGQAEVGHRCPPWTAQKHHARLRGRPGRISPAIGPGHPTAIARETPGGMEVTRGGCPPRPRWLAGRSDGRCTQGRPRPGT